MGFHPKSLHFLTCHGFSESSCKPVSHKTMKFSPVLFALPKANEEYPSGDEEEPIQEHEEHSTLISSDDVKEEQSKKLSSGEVQKLEFEVREAIHDKEFQASARLKAEELRQYNSHDCYGDTYKNKNAEEFDLILRKCTMLFFEPLMCIIAERKEGGNVLNGMLGNYVIGTLDFHVKYRYHLDNFPEYPVNPETTMVFTKSGPQYCFISSITVDKIARQQGVGSSMIKYAIDYATEHSIPQIFVYVPRDNKSAVALYKKMGFKILTEVTAEPLMEQHNLYLFSLNL